ncbi:MAG: cobalamin-dependent protein [Acidobacteriia bacterium]|nr:cobalamin-dependent protein [Terriglobia bacterium]
MKPRIILYNPRSNSSGKKILPMSLLALGAVLEGRYEYNIVDGNASPEPLRLVREQVRQGAGVLAVTVMPGPQLLQAFPECRALKTEYPQLTVVWGGYFPTLHASSCLRSPAVDCVIQGHGELVFLQFLDLLERNGDLKTLDGLAYRDRNGTVIENPPAAIPHPETLPPFPYHRIDMLQYVRSTFLGSRTLGHHSSYGCPFQCNFCAVVNMVDGRWLPQPAELVAEIARLYVRRWQVNAIEFYDNNFFTHEARVAEVAARIAPLRLSWWGEARIDTLLKYSEATWRSMRDSGLKMVFMGAESATAGTLQRMRKGGSMTPAQTLEIAAKTREYGVVPEFSFVVGNPPDAEADVRNTFGFIRRLKKVNPASEIILYNYTPVPLDGELYRAAVAGGFDFPETLEEWVSADWMEFSCRRHARVPWLREGLRRKIRDFEQVLNAYYPTRTNASLNGGHRALLRAASAWRYHTGVYGFPVELRVFQKLLHYQRPETAGF